MVLAALIAAVGILARLADPHRRRDGRRPGVRPGRRDLRRARPAPPRRCALRSLARAGRRLPASRSRRSTSPARASRRSGVSPESFDARRPQPLDNIIAQPGLLRVLRRVLRRRRRDALADDREVGRADRRAHLGDDDPGGRERRRRRRLRRLGDGARVARAARDQPRVAHRSPGRSRSRCQRAVYARRKTKHRHRRRRDRGTRSSGGEDQRAAVAR